MNYKSKCCKKEAHCQSLPNYSCSNCGNFCEVTAMIDEPGGVPKEESHETMHGWCCACDYDQIELNRRLEVQKAEMLSTIKGLGCNPENDSLTIARILNELR